jgi:ribonuclease R
LLGTAQEVVVIPSKDLPLNVGDRVVMKVVEWGTKDNPTECSVSHCLGNISDPSCDIPAAIEEYELRGEFPDKVLKEATSFGKQVSQRDIADRVDLRDLETFTIDPTTAKDFDDALTLSKNKRGFYRLIVHIADVSHYVKEGSAIDIEASQRCNSTYFPGYCLPMLPKALSENLCSLKADVNRLTISVEMNFDTKGNLTSHKIFRSVIKSDKRFTYASAKEVLDGTKKSKHAPTLKLMVELCNLLKVKRFERGSIEFALPDLVIKVDEKGVPFDTEYVSYDITHQMVEEFMLKANETIAMHLDKQGKGVAYRIHEVPSEENMKDFSILASAFGFKLPEAPLPHQLQELFNEAMDTSFGQYLAVSYIRRMRQAQYSPENIGHYGLGLTHYCHFTSPIRRYIDLIIHRSLFEDGLDLIKLGLITKQCSDQERVSAKAENNVVLLKKLRLLNQIHLDNPGKQYAAVVTRVKNFGFSFEILDFLLEGFLHVSELDNDYFVFDSQKQHLEGRHSNKIYASGERISVMLKDVNFISLEGKWSLVSDRQGHRERRPREHKGYRGQRETEGFNRHKRREHDRPKEYQRDREIKEPEGHEGQKRFQEPQEQPFKRPKESKRFEEPKVFEGKKGQNRSQVSKDHKAFSKPTEPKRNEGPGEIEGHKKPKKSRGSQELKAYSGPKKPKVNKGLKEPEGHKEPKGAEAHKKPRRPESHIGPKTTQGPKDLPAVKGTKGPKKPKDKRDKTKVAD